MRINSLLTLHITFESAGDNTTIQVTVTAASSLTSVSHVLLLDATGSTISVHDLARFGGRASSGALFKAVVTIPAQVHTGRTMFFLVSRICLTMCTTCNSVFLMSCNFNLVK